MVGVGRLERPTFWSQTKRATNCAIPRHQLYVVMYHQKQKIKVKIVFFIKKMAKEIPGRINRKNEKSHKIPVVKFKAVPSAENG